MRNLSNENFKEKINTILLDKHMKYLDLGISICKLISELTLLNNQNVELLKHGIIISNKMLDTVINAFAPQGCFYNGAGKTDTHDIDMWTINEEIW